MIIFSLDIVVNNFTVGATLWVLHKEQLLFPNISGEEEEARQQGEDLYHG